MRCLDPAIRRITFRKFGMDNISRYEQAIIGLAILQGKTHNEVALEPAEFESAFLGSVWKRIREMQTVDVVALESEFFDRRRELTEAAANTPTSANMEKLAKRIKDAANTRRAMAAMVKTHDMLKRGGSKAMVEAKNIMLLALDNVGEDGGSKPLSHFLIPAYQATERAQTDGENINFVPTGFVAFDAEFGGLQIGGLIVVAGRPGMGKTAFVLVLLRNAAKHAPVLIISMEMSGQQLAMRFYAAEAGICMQRMMQGKLSADDWSKLAKATSTLMDVGLHINDRTSRTVADVVAEARLFKRIHGSIGMLVVDYLTLMDMPDGRNKNEAVSEATRRLANLAGELGCPVVLVSQLNRELEKRSDKRPIMADLRDSGAIEQDAHQIIFPFRPEVYDKSPSFKGVALIHLAKNRNGCTGTVQMEWVAESATFKALCGE